jgi:hypothetical protein
MKTVIVERLGHRQNIIQDLYTLENLYLHLSKELTVKPYQKMRQFGPKSCNLVIKLNSNIKSNRTQCKNSLSTLVNLKYSYFPFNLISSNIN